MLLVALLVFATDAPTHQAKAITSRSLISGGAKSATMSGKRQRIGIRRMLT